MYYRGASAAVVVFDVTSRESFEVRGRNQGLTLPPHGLLQRRIAAWCCCGLMILPPFLPVIYRSAHVL